ncbi:hypothetical protein HDU67_009215 [Dinochytrium kinnereticum]|nr:hypothetical protein HDU67_009215 [Dinochytrium kinnereticum]
MASSADAITNDDTASSLHSARSVTSPSAATVRLNATPQKLAETTVGVREAAKSIGKVLVKLERPSTVMLVAKAFDPKIIHFTRLLACHLVDTPRPCVTENGLTVYVDSKFKSHPAFDYANLVSLYPHYADRMRFWTPAFCAQHADVIDFIVTLGGDGTVLYTSWLFQHTQVPPVIPFHLGSLGFLTNFNVKDVRDVFERVLGCGSDGIRVNMRMRLSCTVWRYASRIRGGDVSVHAGSGVSVSRPPSTASAATKEFFASPNASFAEAGGEEEEEEEEDGGIVIPSTKIRRSSFSSSLPELSDAVFPSRVGSSSANPKRPSPLHRLQTTPISIDPSFTPPSRLSPFPQTDLTTLLDSICPSLTSKAHPSPDGEEPKGFRGAGWGAAGEVQHRPVPTETFQIINDLVVDRGPSAFMSQLELYVDDRHLTTVQADGLVVATPTGSTAYSLSAGGSITHPEVPSILVTPICPHTLSFRPMLLPDSIELRVQVPRDSRSTAWASFDGRHRIELRQGDAIVVSLGRWPVPTVCDVDQSSDWFESLRRCLHWNERTRQKPFASTSLSAPSSTPTTRQNAASLNGGDVKSAGCVPGDVFCEEAERVLGGEV